MLLAHLPGESRSAEKTQGKWNSLLSSPLNDIHWDTIDSKVLAQIVYMGKIYE